MLPVGARHGGKKQAAMASERLLRDARNFSKQRPRVAEFQLHLPRRSGATKWYAPGGVETLRHRVFRHITKRRIHLAPKQPAKRLARKSLAASMNPPPPSLLRRSCRFGCEGWRLRRPGVLNVAAGIFNGPIRRRLGEGGSPDWTLRKTLVMGRDRLSQYQQVPSPPSEEFETGGTKPAPTPRPQQERRLENP